MTTITFKIVNDRARPNFLYHKLGNALIAFEGAVYDSAGKLCENYGHGYWQFAELSNGGFFMFLDDKEPFVCSAENFAQETINAEAFGITCTLYALSRISFKWHKTRFGEQIADAYRNLLDYARGREDWPQISALID